MDINSWEFLLSGIILMAVVGPAIGNYATSVVYRLPFGQTPFEKNPYCGHCGTMLQPKDLFPIFSYLSTRGKCRYCGGKIRSSFTWIEVSCGIVFITDFLVFGVSELFLLVTALATFMITLAALEYHEQKLFTLVWTWCLSVAALLRVLIDGSIYPMVQSGFLLLFAAIIVWRITSRNTPAPAYVWMALLLGIALPISAMPIALGITAITYGLQRLCFGWRYATIAFSVGIWGGLLAEQLQFIG